MIRRSLLALALFTLIAISLAMALPTITFAVLYCLFVIGHEGRRILHFNITKHPAGQWIVQQLREALPFESAPRFLIFDRDRKYGAEVAAAVRSLMIIPLRTSFECPWQNGVAERWIASCGAICWTT